MQEKEAVRFLLRRVWKVVDTVDFLETLSISRGLLIYIWY